MCTETEINWYSIKERLKFNWNFLKNMLKNYEKFEILQDLSIYMEKVEYE